MTPPLDNVRDVSFTFHDHMNEAESMESAPPPLLDGAFMVPRTVPRARLAPRKLTGKVLDHGHESSSVGNCHMNGGHYTPMCFSPICPSSPVLHPRTPRSSVAAASAPSLLVA